MREIDVIIRGMVRVSVIRFQLPFRLLPAILLLLLMAAPFCCAHTEKQLEEYRHGGLSTGGGTADALGVDEHLGARIPLDLTFRDDNGRQVRLGDLISGPTIILPVYYGCTNVCNFQQQGLASALPAVTRIPVKEYRVLSVSFDENETPVQAAHAKKMYLTGMKASFPEDGWHFLTGDSANVHKLTDAAGVHFRRAGRDFIHPVVSFVVARDGTIVRYLYGTTYLPKDLTLALLEARDGRVGATIRTVVGYCFSFDPTGKTYVFNLLRVSATAVILSVGGFLAYLLLTGRKRRRHVSRNE